MSSEPPLSQGIGYAVVIGIGLFFSLMMLGLTKLQTRYTSFEPSNAEEFTSASRSVKPGLIAAGIVSAWTWSATLLQSSAVAYRMGISGGWWYAAGACVQVLLFAMIASKIKQNAPYCHTFLEIVRARWGATAHIVFLVFGFATNIMVSLMLIVGGSAVCTDLTGMSTVAACFLIPVGVAVYVVTGGLRATLVADYTHTVVLFAIILTFVFTVYGTSESIGSFEKMHELLTAASLEHPVDGNAHGSFLTLRSRNGLIFGVINVIGNFSAVFGDQAYYQRAIASNPVTTTKAFLLGGLAWFAIPFLFSTTLGLAARALSHGENPLVVLTASEISAGLPAPKAAAALMGSGGAAAMLILLFLAVTSATSAEMIATSSIWTYDIYGTYINPKPTEKQIMRASHIGIVGYSIVMGSCAVAMFYAKISMGWLYEFMGTLLGSAVPPIALCMTSKKANKWGCIAGALAGFISGIVGWLVCTYKLNDGSITIETSGGDFEMLTGNLLAIGISGIVSLLWTLVKPDDFDWAITRSLNAPGASPAPVFNGENANEEGDLDAVDDEKKDATATYAIAAEEGNEVVHEEIDIAGLQKAFRLASIAALTLAVTFLLVIPLPLFFAQTIFGVKGFTAWVVIGMIWIFCSCGAVVIYPLYESRSGLAQVFRGIIEDMRKPGSGKYDRYEK